MVSADSSEPGRIGIRFGLRPSLRSVPDGKSDSGSGSLLVVVEVPVRRKRCVAGDGGPAPSAPARRCEGAGPAAGNDTTGPGPEDGRLGRQHSGLDR
jgi:hypothetical protein